MSTPQQAISPILAEFEEMRAALQAVIDHIHACHELYQADCMECRARMDTVMKICKGEPRSAAQEKGVQFEERKEQP